MSSASSWFDSNNDLLTSGSSTVFDNSFSFEKEIDTLESERQKLHYLGNQVGILTKVLEKTKGEIKNLHKEKTSLETRLREIRNSNEYKKIRLIAEEEVTNHYQKEEIF